MRKAVAIACFAFGFLVPLPFCDADTIYFSNQNSDSIQTLNTTNGNIGTLTGTDSFVDPPYYPYGLTVDGSGNVFVALSANYGGYGVGAIKEFSSSGSFVSKPLTSTTVLPYSLTRDSANNLYFIGGVAGQLTFELDELSNTGTLSTLYSFPLFHNPSSVISDSSGNLYVADGINIVKFTSTLQMSTFATLSDGITGLTFDSTGNLYASTETTDEVLKISNSGTVSTYATGFDNPSGLAFDLSGNLYVANDDNNPSNGSISKITTSQQVLTVATGLYHPQYLASEVLAIPEPSTFNLFLGGVLAFAVCILRPRGISKRR